MDFRDIEKKSEKELRDLLQEEHSSLLRLLFQAREGQLKAVHRIRAARRTIARLLTALRGKRVTHS